MVGHGGQRDTDCSLIEHILHHHCSCVERTMYEYVGRFKAAKKRIQLLENALRMSGIPVPLRSDFLAEMLMGKELMGSGHAEVMCTKKHKIEE